MSDAFLGFILAVEADGTNFSHLDNLQDYLSLRLVDANQDHHNLRQQVGPEFMKAVKFMTGMHLPLSIAMTMNAWDHIVDGYKDTMRKENPARYMRFKKLAQQKPDPQSHVHYMKAEPGQDPERAIFGRLLVSDLTPYRKLAAQFNKLLPELEARPSVRLIGNTAGLSVYLRCKDRSDTGPDIRDVLRDYLQRAAKGRGHLRVVGGTGFSNDPPHGPQGPR
ncbi:MAG: hypothetical protein H6867_01505 [Rhodospirillales bacterium]|nr:hypothetical protein [Rhodospirillales bacterium]MCB9997193.1 hypothetical protein [Rhodospirillales bacterium]